MWWMPAWLDKRLPHLHIERPDEPTAEATQADEERPKVAH